MTRSLDPLRVAGAAVSMLLLAATSILALAAGPGGALSEDCFDELENGRGAEIACTVPLKLTQQERTDLKKATREYLHDLECSMTIRIDRAKVNEAIRAADLVFRSPDQPVTCKVTTAKTRFDVTATFAPRVVFKGGKAVTASPGLGNVKGVSRVLSWPVVTYVNYGPGMRSGLLQVVNAYREHRRKKAAAAPAP
jgi:hypothetical protein